MTATDHAELISGVPLTIEEFDELPGKPRKELVDGIVQITPRPSSHHQRVMRKLLNELDDIVQDPLEVLAEVDVLLAERTARSPDVVVVDHVDDDRIRFSAAEVTLAVEIVSSNSRTVDRDHKPIEYARAGIPHYWRVELEPAFVVHTFRLGDGQRYVESGVFTPGDTIRAPGLQWAAIEVDRITP